ncbi:endothelin-3b [Genypterus blacodes]|uniref:endothelin-3b n=1 Tax=Genypterus blacodes TaxID=154954 RepID=UPI003F77529D
MGRTHIHARLATLIAPVLILLQGVFMVDALVKPGGLTAGFGPGRSAQGAEVTASKTRPKRCTCYSYRDKECIYYCHLDIIWINTPERTVPYGMSSYRGHQRLRRAAGRPAGRISADAQRCVCAELEADAACLRFCESRPSQSRPHRSFHRA